MPQFPFLSLLVAEPGKLKQGDKVIASEPQVKQFIETKYSIELIKEYYNLPIYRITGLNA